MKTDININCLDNDWMQVISGDRVFPLNATVESITIEDIAWALSMQCRYAGHVKKFYSVAEHSVLMSRAIPSEHALWALLHDAPEAYLTDIPRPIKVHLKDYKVFENKLMAVIAEKFGLLLPEPPIVKEYDNRVCMNELRDVLTPLKHTWGWLVEPLPDTTIEGWEPIKGFREFLFQYRNLTGEPVNLHFMED